MNKPILLTVLAILFIGNTYGQTPSNGTENSHMLDSVVVYNYSDGDTVWSEKQVYWFDEAGHTILEAYFVWDSELNDWVGYEKYEYSYDEDGNQILLIWYNWDSEINDWVLRKYENSYDKKKRLWIWQTST